MHATAIKYIITCSPQPSHTAKHVLRIFCISLSAWHLWRVKGWRQFGHSKRSALETRFSRHFLQYLQPTKHQFMLTGRTC